MAEQRYGHEEHWLFNAQRLKKRTCFCGAKFETYQPQRKYCDIHKAMTQTQLAKAKAEVKLAKGGSK